MRRLHILDTLKSPKIQPKLLWAHTPCVCVCVTACSACADRANSVGEYAPQITPLERLRVGKQSPAKHWCPGPHCLLTHNASRGPAGCCGPSSSSTNVVASSSTSLVHRQESRPALQGCWRWHLTHPLPVTNLTC